MRRSAGATQVVKVNDIEQVILDMGGCMAGDGELKSISAASPSTHGSVADTDQTPN